MTRDLRPLSRVSLAIASTALALLLSLAPARALAQDDARKMVAVTGRTTGFTPPTIEVRQNDLVHVTLTAEDGPHAFVIDAYRIAKRSVPGRPSIFEFLADQVGTFSYYCSLATANGQTHDERGTLTVRR